MTDFLLELRSEEIPARMQAGARTELEKLFRQELIRRAFEIANDGITVWSTPRRLALIARGLPDQTDSAIVEVKGPKADAPEQALEGFLRKHNATRDHLVERNGILFLDKVEPGLAMKDVLAEAIPAIVRGFAWPKSMRWGKESASSESLRWVRPLSGIVAIFGEDLVPCEIGGIASGFATRGHRFHCPGEINIGSASDYAEKLRACHVIVDHEERQAIIRDGAAKAAADAGLTLVEDEGLVIENAGLTEWPAPLLGRFDEAFLKVPPEVIQLTARVNQKYFVVNGADGKLANGFVCTANIDAKDGGAEIVAGNRKVLAARLSDARFFWEQDRKTKLEDHVKKLDRITFHEKLGTVADKVERVAKLAEWLASEGIVPNCDPALARRAAELAKADLVTEMVGEFPELQGLMGGYYARAEGLPEAVADAIRDHYKPVGQGDDVPTAPVTVAVALADKLDTLSAFFAINEKPTGSRDPFALRRAALGIISIIQANELRLSVSMPLAAALAALVGKLSASADRFSFEVGVQQLEAVGVQFSDDAVERLRDVALQNALDRSSPIYDQIIQPSIASIILFLADRLKVQQREAGVRHDLIDAVFALGGEDDLVRLLARVKALQAFMATEDGANLLAGYKRAANILKQAGEVSGTAATTPPTDADAALLAALDTAEPAAREAVDAESFTDAMAALASLRAPIDAFFEGVMVNDPDEAVRAYRLGLLSRFTGAVHGVADFSTIEG